MLKAWMETHAPKCIILCAGRGDRLNPLTEDKPKVMAEINGRPLIHYVIDFWRQFTESFVFIVGYKKGMVIDYVSRQAVNSAFIEQKERKGIAHAILHAENEIDDKFIVVLGDCLCRGEFKFPEGMDQGVGIWRTSDTEAIHQSYSVDTNGAFIKQVVEKPKMLINDLCGMGYYFFRKKLFDYIRMTPPSSLRNEVEITDVIQKMIDAGEPISPVWFDGDYLNVTFPEDIKGAVNMIDGL